MNANLCMACMPADTNKNGLSLDVADTGVCGGCKKVSDVFDLELLSEYRKLGLADLDIWRNLRRLRSSHMNPSSHEMSLDALIGQAQEIASKE